eukprot:1334440-Ditylum_brightwellii.AAC.1
MCKYDLQKCSELSKEDIKEIGSILAKNDANHTHDVHKVCSKALEKIPLITMERECMKRIIKLCDILSIVTDRCIQQDEEQSVIFIVIKSILEEMHSVSDNVIHHDRLLVKQALSDGTANSRILYKRAKSHALQRAFSELCAAVLSWLLRMSKPRGDGDDRRMIIFVRDSIVVPSLLKRGDELRINMGKSSASQRNNYENQSQPIPHFDFNLIPIESSAFLSNSIPDTSAKRLSNDLFLGVHRRVRDFIVHIASRMSERQSSFLSLYNAVLNAGILLNDDLVSTAIGLALRSDIDERATMRQLTKPSTEMDALQTAVDVYFFALGRERTFSNKDDIQAVGFSKEKKVSGLVILQHLMVPRQSNRRRFSGNNNGSHQNISVEENQDFLNLGSDISAIAKGLFHCLFDAIRGDGACGLLIENIFTCARGLLTLPIHGNTSMGISQAEGCQSNRICLTVQEWSYSKASGIDSQHHHDSTVQSLSNVGIYLSQFSKIMHTLAKLVTDESALIYLQYLISTMEKEGYFSSNGSKIILNNLKESTDANMPPLVKSLWSMIVLQSKIEKNIFPEVVVQSANKKNAYLEIKVRKDPPEKKANGPNRTNWPLGLA